MRPAGFILIDMKLPENIKSIVIVGDIHGEFKELVYQMTWKYKMSDTLVIVAGDCA